MIRQQGSKETDDRDHRYGSVKTWHGTMLTMTTPEMEMVKEIPGYKVILKAILKGQIQLLVEQLALHTDEESIILTASVADGTLSHLGSVSGKLFLENHEDIKSEFLGHCLRRHHDTQQKDKNLVQTSQFQLENVSHIVQSRLSQKLRHEPYPTKRPSKRSPSHSRSASVGNSPETAGSSALNGSGNDNNNTISQVETLDQSQSDNEEVEARKKEHSLEIAHGVSKEGAVNEETVEQASSSFDGSVRFNAGTRILTGEGEVLVKIETDVENEHFIQENPSYQQLPAVEATTDNSSNSPSGSKQDQSMELVSGQVVGEGMSPVRVHVCDLCGKPFPSKWELGRHRRTHTGERPYKCEYCSKSFSDKSNMNQHIRGVHLRQPFRKDRTYRGERLV